MKKLNFFATLLLVAISTSVTFAQTISSGLGGALVAPNTNTSNLNVGFATTNPSAALHILSGTNPGMLIPAIKLDRNDGTNQAGLLTVGLSSNGFSTGLLGGGSAYFKLEDPYGNSANRDMGFSTNGNAAQFVIKNNGFIGAGTELPTANFHSIGTARLESLPTSTTNTSIITADANGNLFTQNASTLFTSSGWNLNGNTATTSDFIGTINSNPLNFKTDNLDRMIILANGNLGLGTTNPTAALHLVTGVGTNQTPPIIKLDRNDGTNQSALLTVGLSSNGFTNFSGMGGGTAYFKVEDPYGNTPQPDMAFSTNNIAPQLIIKNNGTIGLGTNSPSAGLDVQNGTVRIGNVNTPNGYKLYVEQGILTEKVKVAVASSLAWADYVFANDYKLKPLAEVEAFIKENKHLPNVPSANELVNEGIDLGKMQATQMEKIEELTLYIIEMKKEIETLKNQNALLTSKISKK